MRLSWFDQRCFLQTLLISLTFNFQLYCFQYFVGISDFYHWYFVLNCKPWMCLFYFNHWRSLHYLFLKALRISMSRRVSFVCQQSCHPEVGNELMSCVPIHSPKNAIFGHESLFVVVQGYDGRNYTYTRHKVVFTRANIARYARVRNAVTV